MIELIIGSVMLSFIHVLIPNHWVPMVVIAKSEKWSPNETLSFSALIAFAHTLSTITLGIVIGLVGLKLAEEYLTVTRVIASVVLMFMGINYFGLNLRRHSHEHFPEKKELRNKSKLAIVLSLFITMLFSPCLEIETYFFKAGIYGWKGIMMVSIIYLTISILGIVILVYMGCKGIEKYNWHFIEHHERKITGITLIALGILSFFIKY